MFANKLCSSTPAGGAGIAESLITFYFYWFHMLLSILMSLCYSIWRRRRTYPALSVMMMVAPLFLPCLECTSAYVVIHLMNFSFLAAGFWAFLLHHWRIPRGLSPSAGFPPISLRCPQCGPSQVSLITQLLWTRRSFRWPHRRCGWESAGVWRVR